MKACWALAALLLKSTETFTLGGEGQRHLIRRLVRENVNGDKKQYFPRDHKKESSELEIGLIVVRANGRHQLGMREISRKLGPVNSSEEGFKTNRITAASTPVCAVSFYNVFRLGGNSQVKIYMAFSLLKHLKR